MCQISESITDVERPIHQIVNKENVSQQPIERINPSVFLSTHPAPARNRREAEAVIVRQSER